jgi:hypothetical protein
MQLRSTSFSQARAPAVHDRFLKTRVQNRFCPGHLFVRILRLRSGFRLRSPTPARENRACWGPRLTPAERLNFHSYSLPLRQAQGRSWSVRMTGGKRSGDRWIARDRVIRKSGISVERTREMGESVIYRSSRQKKSLAGAKARSKLLQLTARANSCPDTCPLAWMRFGWERVRATAGGAAVPTLLSMPCRVRFCVLKRLAPVYMKYT